MIKLKLIWLIITHPRLRIRSECYLRAMDVTGVCIEDGCIVIET